MEFICDSLEKTKFAAEYFSEFAKPGQCFALYGDLGYGKTTFSRFLIQCLNRSIKEVTSPTFTIIQVYSSKIAEIWHIDCYRLKNENEFYDLGIDEIMSTNITIIEWPEIIQHFLPSDSLKINFSLTGKVRKISAL
ncbi:MAG: tRNA (adenosine(37)-N6)-threonylcarbamoyltransferase complex ATPase subunit type 1 TsaE [Holosporaceae bacterium]|jgi:tRNA threonylcarbamoyladenosine biosynthesis protein TsaE|nr:tRNA (adenosine(37)-N6)-threonylcarbamoyltransferase complex ATPase subunit type 1 TsaE [Holosporaceae bacterium]